MIHIYILDLTQELRVRVQHFKIDKEKRFVNVDSNKLQVEMETQTSGSPLKSKLNSALHSPRTFGSVLNILGSPRRRDAQSSPPAAKLSKFR